MLFRMLTVFRNHLWTGGVLAAFAVALAAVASVLAQNSLITLSTLIDRAQIEDMLVDYYEALSAGSTHFDSYYTDDAVVDVNGIVKHGKGPIDDLYKTIPKSKGTVHLLLTNPKIVIDGDSATADVIWTRSIRKLMEPCLKSLNRVGSMTSWSSGPVAGTSRKES